MEIILTPAVARRPRQTMLPLLVALFLISYILLTTLVVLQNRTIDAQRGLIHLLFKDNLHLTAMKAGLHKNAVTRSNPAPGNVPSHNATQVQPTQTPSNKVSAVQTPSAQVPVIDSRPQASTKAGRNSKKAQKTPPALPPAEMTDPSDMRRVMISI